MQNNKMHITKQTPKLFNVEKPQYEGKT